MTALSASERITALSPTHCRHANVDTPAVTTASAIKADTVFQGGDKVIAISSSDCETELREQLIGSAPAITPA